MRRNHSSRSFPADSGTLSSVMAASAACTSRIDWATNSSGGSAAGGGAASNSEVGASSISSNTASTDDGSGNGCGYRTEAQYAIRDEAPRSLPKRAPSHCCLRSASRTSLPLPWTYTIVMPMLASPQHHPRCTCRTTSRLGPAWRADFYRATPPTRPNQTWSGILHGSNLRDDQLSFALFSLSRSGDTEASAELVGLFWLGLWQSG